MAGRSLRDWPNAIGLVRLYEHAGPTSDVRTRRTVPPPPPVVFVPHRARWTRYRSDERSVPPAAARTAAYVLQARRAGQAERRRRVPRPHWPFAIERDYARDLVAILEDLRRRTDAVLGELPELVESARREREDAAALLEREVVGLRVVIENPAGSVREWIDSDGTKGQTVMRWSYGYLDGFEGADGEDVDVYVGPIAEPTEVYVVHQRKKGEPDAEVWFDYDEDKVMLGWDSADAAKAAYLAQYDDPRFFGGMSVFTVDDFKRRLRANPGRKLTHADPRQRRLRVDVGEGQRARVLLDRAREGIAVGATQAEIGAVAAARAVGANQKKQLAKQTKAGVGVDLTPVLTDPKWAAMIDGFVSENVSLIKTLETKTLDDLEKLITRGFADGMRASELGALIAERWGIAERHARLIARDQIGKLNGQITRARHKELGLTKFRWLTMRDPKVRPRHQPMEGKTFSYEGEGRPPFFPGQEICCRCLEEPLFDDINAILDELEAAPPPALSEPFVPPTPPEDTPEFQAERQRMAEASAAARAAAAEDLAAFNAHLAKEKAWAEKVAAAKAKQAKLLAEHKAKMAAELAAKEAAEKAAKEAAEKAAKEAAEKAAAELAAKQAAEAALAAQKAAELAAKRSAAARKAAATRAANKARREAEAAAAAAARAAETGTVRYAAIAPQEYAGFHGRGFVQDADAIEGGSVRVVKVRGADGDYFEAVFKLTSPYGQAARAFGTEAVSSWTFRQRELVAGELRDLAKTQTTPNAARVWRGARRGNTVEIGTSGALTNQVRIRATSLSELDASLENLSRHLGIDLSKAPTRADLELQAKARLAAKFDPKEFGRRMMAVRTPAEQREVIEHVFEAAARRHPVMRDAVADARIEEVYPGHRTLYSPSLGKYMSKQWGALYHDGSPPAEVAARIVADTGLMSSVKRYNSGVFTTGMSTTTDFSTGGADGVFMRVAKAAPASASGRFRAVIDTSKVMGRMDWWAFNFDNFGRAGYGQYAERWSIPDQIGATARSSNEVMATHGVPPSAFKKFIVGEERYRRQILEELARMGVREINGKPVAEFIVVQ